MATFVKAPCDEGVIRSAPDAAPSSARVGLWVLVATILGSSMAFISVFTSSLESHLATLHLSPGVQQAIEVQRVKLAAITLPTNVGSETQVALKNAIDESFVSSFRVVSLICTVLALASALSAWLLVAGKKPAPEGSTVKKSV